MLTAARHDRKSFGGADENDFTYFGRAFFKEALPQSTSFQQAFAVADKLIEKWETKDQDSTGRRGDDDAQRGPIAATSGSGRTGRPADRRSLPQIADAKPIADRLAAWWKQRGAK